MPDEDKLLTFDMDGEGYAFDASSVHSIIRPDAVTRLPGAQKCLLGLINLRSTVIPLVSLRCCFKLDTVPVDRFTRIVVMERRGKHQGIMVDKVLDVLDSESFEILHDVPFPRSVDVSFFRYFVKSGGRTFLVVNADRILGRVIDELRPNLALCRKGGA